MIQFSQVQQAAVAFQLRAFKTAPDPGQIIFHPVRALQHRIFFQVQFHITVQPKRSCKVYPRRKINRLSFAAVINGLLQRSGIHDSAVSHGIIRGLRHIQPLLLLPRPYSAALRKKGGHPPPAVLRQKGGQLFAPVHRFYLEYIFGFCFQPVNGYMCFIGNSLLFLPAGNPVFTIRRTFRLLPVKSDGIFGGYAVYLFYPGCFPSDCVCCLLHIIPPAYRRRACDTA